MRLTASPGTGLSGTRNCNTVSRHTIPHDSRIPTPQKRVISLPLVFEIPLPAPVFNLHLKSRPQNKPDSASRQTYCGPSSISHLKTARSIFFGLALPTFSTGNLRCVLYFWVDSSGLRANAIILCPLLYIAVVRMFFSNPFVFLDVNVSSFHGKVAKLNPNYLPHLHHSQLFLLSEWRVCLPRDWFQHVFLLISLFPPFFKLLLLLAPFLPFPLLLPLLLLKMAARGREIVVLSTPL